ncbi:MAG TPA: hypothetical protein GX734_06200 [Clostridiaceae bacterium]|nr:hypothetical protein [Clostridiaceae bacterium]
MTEKCRDELSDFNNRYRVIPATTYLGIGWALLFGFHDPAIIVDAKGHPVGSLCSLSVK